MTLISIKGLAFSHRRGEYEVPLFQDFSFEINRGEVVAILGPSGCGKTTLLNLMAGFFAPDKGEVRIDGEPAVTRTRTMLAFAFHTPPLLPHLDVLANARLPCELMGRADAGERAREALAQVGLRGCERFYPHQLSAGMRSRVGFAAAIATSPDILLLDEPHGALDPITRRVVSKVIRDAIRSTSQGMTVVLATHNEAEALELADRCVVLSSERPVRIIGAEESDGGSIVPSLAPSDGSAPSTNSSAARLHARLSDALITPVCAVVGLEKAPPFSSSLGAVELREVREIDDALLLQPKLIVFVGTPPRAPTPAELEATGGRCIAVADHAPDGWKVVASFDEAIRGGVGIAHKRSVRRRVALERVLQFAASLLLVAAVWIYATDVRGVEAYILPPLGSVLRYIVEQWSDLRVDVLRTTSEAAAGLGLGTLVATLTGLMMRASRIVDRATWPLLVASQAVPFLAIAPVLHLWFPGIESIVIMASLVAFFPIAVAFRTGLLSPRWEERMIFALYRASWMNRLVRLEVPRSLVHFFSGLRTAAPLAVIGALIAEFTGTDRGLGHNLQAAVRNVRPQLLFASLILSTAMGAAFYALTGLIESKVTARYRDGSSNGERP